MNFSLGSDLEHCSNGEVKESNWEALENEVDGIVCKGRPITMVLLRASLRLRAGAMVSHN